MEFASIIIALLILAVIGLFAFSLTEPRGKNTVYARKSNPDNEKMSEIQSADIRDSISHS